MDIASWNPQEIAVLMFLHEPVENKILLIHKLRGHGKGKINAPGGRCERQESPMGAAVRETLEEVGITVHSCEERGKLRFIFADGYQLEGRIFWSDVFSGKAINTPEAIPFWCNVNEIPYDKMWEDDRLWLPEVIKGNYIESFFTFDGDNMNSHDIISLMPEDPERKLCLNPEPLHCTENYDRELLQEIYNKLLAAGNVILGSLNKHSQSSSIQNDLLIPMIDFCETHCFTQLKHATKLLSSEVESNLSSLKKNGFILSYLNAISFLQEKILAFP